MEKMISKIKALLAKAQGTDNEAEAEIFFAKAYELMEKHQLGTDDLDKDDPMGHGIGYTRKGAVAPDWDYRLMFAVARYYGCKGITRKTADARGYWSGNEMDLIGRESARVTAMAMHEYLVTAVRRLGKTNGPLWGMKPETAARRIGVHLKARLDQLSAERNADKPRNTAAGKNMLTTVDQVKALVEKLYPEMRTIKSTGLLGNANAAKVAEGISLAHQVNNEGTRRLR